MIIINSLHIIHYTLLQENLELRRKEFEKERQEQRNRTLEAQGKKLEAISVAQHGDFLLFHSTVNANFIMIRIITCSLI